MESPISNFYEFTTKIGTSGQPEPEDFTWIKENGYHVVLNITPSYMHYYLEEEAEICKLLNLKYIHFPIDYKDINVENFSTFSNLLNENAENKMLIHCGANVKVSVLMHAYMVLKVGRDEAKSQNVLFKIQYPDKYWNQFYKSLGLNPI